MAQTIDFRRLLRDLFQGDMPIKEKVYEHPQPQKNGADFSSALGEIFQAKPTEKSASRADTSKANTPPLQACNLYVFMRKIIMENFGMGYDYAIEINGKPLQSWFTIPEAIEVAKSLGYELTIAEARRYLEKLIQQKYIETDNYKYRRCAFWDKHMEKYLQGV